MTIYINGNILNTNNSTSTTTSKEILGALTTSSMTSNLATQAWNDDSPLATGDVTSDVGDQATDNFWETAMR